LSISAFAAGLAFAVSAAAGFEDFAPDASSFFELEQPANMTEKRTMTDNKKEARRI
jgi:hypothetical protein